jgi:hypothetical protein
MTTKECSKTESHTKTEFITFRRKIRNTVHEKYDLNWLAHPQKVARALSDPVGSVQSAERQEYAAEAGSDFGLVDALEELRHDVLTSVGFGRGNQADGRSVPSNLRRRPRRPEASYFFARFCDSPTNNAVAQKNAMNYDPIFNASWIMYHQSP